MPFADDHPEGPLPGDLPERPPCPFCGGERTELHSLFGSHASVTTYWCRSCRSPFEQMRWGKTGLGPDREAPPADGDRDADEGPA